MKSLKAFFVSIVVLMFLMWLSSGNSRNAFIVADNPISIVIFLIAFWFDLCVG